MFTKLSYRHLLLTVIAFLITCGSAFASTQTVQLPFTVDYPLLRKLMVNASFPENNETATLINEGGGCIYLALSSPQISAADGNLRLLMQVSARAGTPLGGRCFTPVSWQGYLELYEQPAINPANWDLSFTTVGSSLLGPDKQPTQITDILWNLIKPHIWNHISGMRISLLPPVTDLKNFILPLFPNDKRRQTERMLASMRPAELGVDKDALHFTISTEVESVYEHDSANAQGALSDEELRKTVAVWENWDGLLVYLVTKLAGQVVTETDKRTLTNALLDTRYRFVNELSDRTIGKDIVREQFVSVWQELAPLFRKNLLRNSEAASGLGYLAFVASADALVVFDRLGPTLGLEISTGGLVRLAGMLHADPSLLEYRSDVNTELQELFRFQPEQPESTAPAAPEKTNSMLDDFLNLLGPARAIAAEPLPSFKEILQWKVPKSDLGEYLKRVEGVLRTASSEISRKAGIPGGMKEMYRILIPAMAWQESCFRQFVVKGDQLTYLISYNGSSVGLMQVNERVWRGLYDLNRLRWDIGYNAAAGSEIAAHYLTRYGLRDEDLAKKLGATSLARLVYAMYNGGPSQYNKFLDRLKTRKMYDSDKLFWEKYQWVTAGELDKVSICLIGK